MKLFCAVATVLCLSFLTVSPAQAQYFRWCSEVCANTYECLNCVERGPTGQLVRTTCCGPGGGVVGAPTEEDAASSTECVETQPTFAASEIATWPECNSNDDCAGKCPGDVRCDAGGCLCLDGPLD